MADDDFGDYDVGYGRPPKHTRFRPGQSGNRKGRPKKSKNLDTLILQELDRKVRVTEAGTPKKVSKREAIVLKLVNGGLAGDPRQLEFLLKYLRSTDAPDEFVPAPEDDALLDSFLNRRLRKPEPPDSGWRS
jgi:hypothetical protein